MTTPDPACSCCDDGHAVPGADLCARCIDDNCSPLWGFDNDQDLERLAGYAELSDGLTFAQTERDRLIRNLRADGITLARLAEASGLSEGRVSRIARAKGPERGSR